VNNRRAIKVLATIALLVVIFPFIAHVQPWVVGADQSYIVESGSMEPNLPVGSVIFVDTDVSAKQVEEGDIISFTQGRGTIPTTHRVHEKRTATVDNTTTVSFITKGDNNEDPDPDPVYRDEIVGKYMFHIPFIGYVIAFAGTDLGWLVLVVVPMFLLFADGVWELYQAVDREDNGE